MEINTYSRNMYTPTNHNNNVRERIGIPEDVEIKVKELSKEELDRLKFLGPLHKDEMDWNTIEQEFLNTETENVIRIGTELDGQVIFDPKLMDAEFMDRLVVMEKKYRDNINKVFKGDEKNQHLKKLNEIFERTKKALTDKFTDIFSNFFKEDFNKEEFTQTIENMMSEKQVKLQTLAEKNKDEWYRYRTFSFDKPDFPGMLAKEENSQTPSSMSYEDMKILALGIQEVNRNIQHGMIHSTLSSTEDLGVYLGQAMLKGKMIVKNSKLSISMQEAFEKTLRKNISQEIENIIQYRKEKFKEMNIPEQNPINLDKVKEIINKMADLSKKDAKSFRNAYLEHVQEFGKYHGEFNRQYIRYDWNKFLDHFALSDAENYQVPMINGGQINLSV